MRSVNKPIWVRCVARVVFVWLCLQACGGVCAAEPGAMPEVMAPDPGVLVTGVVHRVIDGDSVELLVRGAVVRYELAGADAPDVIEGAETTIRGSVEARDYLQSLLGGEQVSVLPDARKPIDALGRARGYLYRMPDGLFVNLEMVRLGHAKHAKDPLGFNDAVMLWAQGMAREAQKGVWAPMPENVGVVAETVAGVVIEQHVEETTRADGAETGEGGDAKGGQSAGVDARVVYITKTGSKYHRKDCQHVRESGIAKRRDELDDSYTACKVCHPDEDD